MVRTVSPLLGDSSTTQSLHIIVVCTNRALEDDLCIKLAAED